MGSGGSKPAPGYMYAKTCRNASGIPCSRTYTMYREEDGQLQKDTFVAPFRAYRGEEELGSVDYAAAMVVKFPKNPSKTTPFEAECVEEHNICRARHGVGPLKLDKKLCKYANSWAEELAKRNNLQHREDSPYGENIYMACGKDIDGRMPVKAWYQEISRYPFDENQFSMETGHFTQVVWKDSKKLGVGVATSARTTYVVCNYDPPGNFNDLFIANVPPPI